MPLTAAGIGDPNLCYPLQMIEIGNGPDFLCETDAASLARCQAHFT